MTLQSIIAATGGIRCAALLLSLASVCDLGNSFSETVEISNATPQMYSFNHPAMGTTYSLFLYADSQQHAQDEATRAFDEVDDVEALLSNYQPQSELSRINTLGFQQPVTTDPETLVFLKQSLAWSRRSDGAFDITVGALMQAWGFFRSTGHVPSQSELDTVREKTGWQRVQISEKTRSVQLSAAGLQLDPGGIGKGFAVDRVVQILRRDGVHAALLSAGSSTIYAVGAPPGKQGWRIEVPDPLHKERSLASVVLRDTSLSTASCAEKHFYFQGHLYCHIMDPRLLHPVEGRLQATVIAPSATDSDALSNVMFVDTAQARAAFMQTVSPAIRAIVVDGVPVSAQVASSVSVVSEDSSSSSSCTRYRWTGTVHEVCSEAPKRGSPSRGHAHTYPIPISGNSVKEIQ